ncbi:hypothetical protein TNCV_508481 [Trichonephila clavipes]|nr:hypothetical protein TNCV_508481 [Trichonephila clavipes]
MDSWPACHEFKPGTTDDPPCRGGPMNLYYVEAQTSSHWCGKLTCVDPKEQGVELQAVESHCEELLDFNTELKENITKECSKRPKKAYDIIKNALRHLLTV